MYNALRDKGGHGSTKLHGDVADAWNLLLHANPVGSTADWHMFAPEDADALAEYMRRKLGCKGNPIHHQQTYLTASDLADLREATGIRPFVISQKEGDMVFIPVGCPHQVRTSLFYFSNCY